MKQRGGKGKGEKMKNNEQDPLIQQRDKLSPNTLQIYTAGNGTHVKNVKVTSICCRYYNVEVQILQ